MNSEEKIILLVEDSILVSNRMMEMLHDVARLQVIVHAGTFHEAINFIEEFVPDVVLLDIHLPDRSGIELLRIIREKYNEIIVMVVTNKTGDYHKAVCKKLGAHHFIDKSNEFEDIPAMVAEAL